VRYSLDQIDFFVASVTCNMTFRSMNVWDGPAALRPRVYQSCCGRYVFGGGDPVARARLVATWLSTLVGVKTVEIASTTYSPSSR
jgi:hypothetical protein